MRRLSGQLTVVAVGKIRTTHWQAAQADYAKRLGRYTRIQLVEVKDSVGRGLPDFVAVQKEGERLLKAVTEGQYCVALTPEGRQMTSPQLARFLAREVERSGQLAFLVGGPLGFADEVLAACHSRLSLSRLTFPHEIARIVLLEQLYRACTILSGEPYHK